MIDHDVAEAKALQNLKIKYISCQFHFEKDIKVDIKKIQKDDEKRKEKEQVQFYSTIKSSISCYQWSTTITEAKERAENILQLLKYNNYKAFADRLSCSYFHEDWVVTLTDAARPAGTNCIGLWNTNNFTEALWWSYNFI